MTGTALSLEVPEIVKETRDKDKYNLEEMAKYRVVKRSMASQTNIFVFYRCSP